MPIPIAFAAQAVNSLVRGITGIFQNKKANKIHPVDATYSVSPYARDQYALAKQYLNGRMPGASSYEQNILGSQANMLDNVNRNATDGSQALAMAAASEGQTNQSLADLAGMEAQNKNAMLNNYNQASAGMTEEARRVYEDQVRKYNNQVQEKNALRQAAWQNIGGAMNDATNAVIANFPGKFGGGGRSQAGSLFSTPSVSTMPYNTSIDTSKIGPPPATMNPAWLNMWRAPMLLPK